MPIDFDRPINRNGTGSMKWTPSAAWPSPRCRFPTLLAMWVADMDFPSPPAVAEALHQAVEHGIFGYPVVRECYVRSVLDWHRRHFAWNAQAEWLVPIAGVVDGIKTAIQTFTRPGDSVLVQTPVYGHFTNDPILNDRRVVKSALRFDGVRHHFDPHAFEAVIEPETTLFILCNPHNPTGNVWSPKELNVMNEICLAKGIAVISDEIHQDFVFAPSRHTSFASLGTTAQRNSVILTSASKTFNLAGLKCANAFIANEEMRQRFVCRLRANGSDWINSFGLTATEAAYSHGDTWLREVKLYIEANRRLVVGALEAAGSPLRVLSSDALYLLWIDASKLDTNGEPISDYFFNELGIWVDPGTKFDPQRSDFFRLNIACPRILLEEAISRIVAGKY